MAKSFTAKIITEVKELTDGFIFSTIYPFCSEAVEMHISKKELTDALMLWKKLVRCENCKYHDAVNLNCEYLAATTLDQWYCWHGERRADNG